MKLPNQFILCALNTPDVATEFKTISALGVATIPVMGRYKGIDEASWLVALHDSADLPKLVRLLMKHNQESYPLVDSTRGATLVYLKDADIQSLGQFVQVDAREALASEAHTYDPHTDTYYVCKKTSRGNTPAERELT